MAKQSKNLQKVQDQLDGTYKNKIQVSMNTDENVHANRKVGDKWFDAEGDQWEQMNGYRSKINKLVSRGIFDAHCKECKVGITKPWDKDVHKADGRCYHCQLNYELDLKFDAPIRWFAYRRLKDFKNMISIETDMEQWIDDREKTLKKNPFDMKVANALSNGNLEMTINKNKS